MVALLAQYLSGIAAVCANGVPAGPWKTGIYREETLMPSHFSVIRISVLLFAAAAILPLAHAQNAATSTPPPASPAPAQRQLESHISLLHIREQAHASTHE